MSMILGRAKTRQEQRLNTGKQTIVQQHLRDEVDINTIVRRFGVQGVLERPGSVGAVYGDFTGITDFESAVEKVTRARESFMKLPALVRERFNNDPGQMVRKAQELSEADFLKLAEPPPAETGGGVVPPVEPAG